MSEDKKPVTKTLYFVDKILSLLILLLGLVMMYLALRDGNVMMAIISVVFLGIGFVKIRDVLPGIFRKLGKSSTAQPREYKNIMIPVSRPEAVESMVRMGSDILSAGGKLNIVNIVEVPPQLPPGARIKKDSARALLKNAAEYADRYGVDSSAEIVSARMASEAIIQLARNNKTDLIMMGSSQRTMTEKMLFGTVADVVLKTAPCDVMVLSYTNKEHPIKYDKILVPTAGYRHSQRALDDAADIARKNDGSITSLYVGSEADAAKGNKILEEARQRAENNGVKSDTKFVAGSVADSIIKTASEGGYSLIIIGATEHPKYYTALLGNIADIVVKKAPCDVLVVRTKG